MRIFALILFFVFPLFLNAQLSGTISDKSGEKLSFASVYVEGTSNGTTSNIDGLYFLNLEPGTYRIVYQYVGFKQQIITIEIGSKPLVRDILLEEDSVELSEIVVMANAEDPAYKVIRKAIEKRKYFKELVDAYSCDVYIKGVQKLNDAPEKIFGQEIGDLGGSLDTNRQGIVYLSESQAKLHFKQPNIYKEEMLSSKLSGDDNGFSFNKASLMNFSFYENFIEIERQIISPIANNALQYYRYELQGTLYDEAGNLINKIKVIPKRNEDPVYRGYIYIVEDIWNIQSTELILTGAAIKQPILDTIVIKQIHVPVQEPDRWMQLSQSLDFKFQIFGFKAKGNFTGIFTNYDLEPGFPEDFFSNEIFKVEEGANDKDLVFWDSIRPIPLTIDEEKDYVKKDSLQIVWKSKSYLDSVDQVQNKFKVWSLIFGYSYNQSYKRRDFSIGSPLTTLQFDPVRGWYGNINIEYNQEWVKYPGRWLLLNPRITYGLSEEKLRFAMKAEYNFDRKKFTNLAISGGQEVMQINASRPISTMINTFYALLDKKHYMKVYDKQFARIDFEQEVVNGFFIKSHIEYAKRLPLGINTNNSWAKKDEFYPSNDPLNEANFEPSFSNHDALVFGTSMRLRIGQKYLTYPDYKYFMESKFPDIVLHYRKAIDINTENNSNFDQLRLELKDDFTLGLVGILDVTVEGGFFPNKKNVPFIDYQHFAGNQTIFGTPKLKSFLLLPYFSHSTTEPYFEGHVEHNFNGFLLDKVPLLSKLNLSTVARFSTLYTKEKKDYFEVSYGLDNLGWGILRIFRFDVVANFEQGVYKNTGFVFGIKI